MNKLNSEKSTRRSYYFIILTCLILITTQAQTIKIASVKAKHEQPLNWIPFNWNGDSVPGIYFDKHAISIQVTVVSCRINLTCN